METNWRNQEKSLKQVIEENRDVSPFIIIKTDVQRRGISFTDAALKRVDENIHQVEYATCTKEHKSGIPSSLIMRDGTSIITGPKNKYGIRDAYVVDVDGNRIVLTDQGEVIEEVFFWEKPKYYDKYTSSGKPMWQVVSARPQRLDIYPHHYCEFWNTPGEGCKYCAAMAISNRTDEKAHLNSIAEIRETVAEAIKEPGRFENIFLTAGSTLSGAELLDDEVQQYIDILKEVGTLFHGKKFPSQLIGTAYNKRQVERLYNETGLMSYTADIEVLGEDKFNWICPGKASKIGYREWKKRLIEASEVFGRGNVNTGLVAGVEMASPKGYATEADALKRTLDEAEDLAQKGVATVGCVWTVSEGSVFFRQNAPSLDFYIKLSKGLDGLRRKYGLNIDMDNYRRCGNHPDTDMSRV